MLPRGNERWRNHGDDIDYRLEENRKRRHRAYLKFRLIDSNRDVRLGGLQGERIDLWKGIWFDGDISCLFSDTNLGKSILAVQIGDEVAHRFGRCVLYYDFEQSHRQFHMRYSTPEGSYPFSPAFKRGTPIYDDGVFDIEDALYSIKNSVRIMEAPFLIIDNLSSLCSSAYSSAAFGEFMTELWKMQHLYDLSILLLAHTSKHSPYRPLGLNNLAFSRSFINHCDSAFAIGQSVSDPEVRYIKQIKDRTGHLVYNTNNVIPCTIQRVNNGLRFVEGKCCTEDSLINRNCLSSAKVDSIRLLASQPNLSYRVIAKALGVSPTTVSNIVAKFGASSSKITPESNPEIITESKPEIKPEPASNSSSEPVTEVVENIGGKPAEKQIGHSDNISVAQQVAIVLPVQAPLRLQAGNSSEIQSEIPSQTSTEIITETIPEPAVETEPKAEIKAESEPNSEENAESVAEIPDESVNESNSEPKPAAEPVTEIIEKIPAEIPAQSVAEIPDQSAQNLPAVIGGKPAEKPIGQYANSSLAEHVAIVSPVQAPLPSASQNPDDPSLPDDSLMAPSNKDIASFNDFLLNNNSKNMKRQNPLLISVPSELSAFYDDTYHETVERIEQRDYIYVRTYRPTPKELAGYPDFFLQALPIEVMYIWDRNCLNDLLVQKALAKGIPVPPRFADVYDASDAFAHFHFYNDDLPKPVWQITPQVIARRSLIDRLNRDFCDRDFNATCIRLNSCDTHRGSDFCTTRELAQFPDFFAQYVPPEVFYRWDEAARFDLMTQRARIAGIAVPKRFDFVYPADSFYHPSDYRYSAPSSDFDSCDPNAIKTFVPTPDEIENFPMFFNEFDRKCRPMRGTSNDIYDYCAYQCHLQEFPIPPRVTEIFPPDTFRHRTSDLAILADCVVPPYITPQPAKPEHL
jgi:DNA-binding Lrp family transcriptional regulator